ncbi:hypothetical protein [Agathobacter ruminis]|uniref:Uncharacterized protein n=2 Tax=Agathobacter ruminis TaxID=1712665 RepID=A0A2G3E112_9FIRM|nr:hypothetical protein [Agathobacter ruminis]PHU36911.1 hypothetical protein CSX02_10425 [Agathobacter ruminis]
MSNKSSENYLDELLYSLNGKGADPVPEESEESKGTEPVFDAQENPVSDEDFLKEFEEDLGISSSDDFLSGFEDDLGITFDGGSRNMGSKDDDLDLFDDLEDLSDADFDELDDFLAELDDKPEKEETPAALQFDDGLPNISDMIDLDSVQAAPADNPPAEADTVLEETPEPQTDTVIEETPAPQTDIPQEEPDLAAEVDLSASNVELPITDAGEPDLAGIDSDDLLNMLSETEGMEGIGDLLSKDEDGTAVDTNDAIGEFAERQMNGEDDADGKGIEAEEEEADTPKKKKKKKKKEAKEAQPGFFKRLLNKLFESDEDLPDDEALDMTPIDGPGVEELSEENMALLRELEGADAQDKPEEEDKKEKKKKEKKEKPKKEKKEKPKKEKKPKKPKEPREKGKPLPKKPVMFLCLLGISIGAMIMIATNLAGYSVPMSQAKNLYDKEEFVEAFSKIEGMKIKEDDEAFYQRALILAEVEMEYRHYLIFKKTTDEKMSDAMRVETLDALVCAAGRYNTHLEDAQEYQCQAQLAELGGKIEEALQADYKMSMDEAIEIYKARTRKQYTILIYKKLKELGLYNNDSNN